jgi:hypothetical protein
MINIQKELGEQRRELASISSLEAWVEKQKEENDSLMKVMEELRYQQEKEMDLQK